MSPSVGGGGPILAKASGIRLGMMHRSHPIFECEVAVRKGFRVLAASGGS
jgi:hypothetical protein